MPTTGMHVDEVPTDAALVRRLLADQFPHWADRPVTPVPSAGTDNAIYRLGDDLFARLPRIDWAVANVAKEFEWVPRLAPHLRLPVPLPVALGAPDHGYPWPWTVCRWLDGDHPVTGTDDEVLARDLAAFIRNLHAIDTTNAPSPGTLGYRGLPLATRDKPTREAIAALDGIIDTDAATAAWDQALAIPRWTGNPVWLHADLTPGNLLCRNGTLSAVLDWGTLTTGDPAVDLIPAWNLLGTNARATFREATNTDDHTWARGQAWALSIALIQLPYYQHTNPPLTANSHHVITEVLAARP